MHKLGPSCTSVMTNMCHPLDNALSAYFSEISLYTDTPNLHTLWALSVFGLGNIWSLSCSKIYMHGYYFPSVAVSFCWVMWKTLKFSFFCKICSYDKSFPNHDMMLRVQRANRSSRNNYWREGGQGGARVEGWVVSTPPSSNTSYAPVLTALPLLEFLHHPIAHELVHNGLGFFGSLWPCFFCFLSLSSDWIVVSGWWPCVLPFIYFPISVVLLSSCNDTPCYCTFLLRQ